LAWVVNTGRQQVPERTGAVVQPAVEDLPVSFAERAYLELRDRLVTLEIRPGAPINDDQLAASLKLGRTPVREALKRLESERLVVAYPRRGTFATEVNITDLRHISEVRQLLEPAAATAAALRANAHDRELLDTMLRQLENDSDRGIQSGELMRLDMQVHRSIYAAAHNPFLQDTLVRYDNLATRIWCVFADRLPDLAGHVGEHGPLLRAIIDGDAQRAGALSHEHVAHFEQAIRAVI